MNKYDYTIVSTCSNVKREDCKQKPIPLREMYVGTVGRLKLRISEFLLDNHYYISPMGPGLVPKNTKCMWYDSLTPTKMMKDPEFIEYHREKAIQADLDIIKYKTIYYIGHNRYIEFLKNVLKGQQVKYLLGKPYPIFGMSNVINNTLATQYCNYNIIDIFNVDENKKIIKLRCIDDKQIVISVVVDDNFKYIKRYDISDFTNTDGFKKYLIDENYDGRSYKKLLDRYKNKIKVKRQDHPISHIKIQFDLQEIFTNYTYDSVIMNRIKQRMVKKCK